MRLLKDSKFENGKDIYIIRKITFIFLYIVFIFTTVSLHNNYRWIPKTLRQSRKINNEVMKKLTRKQWFNILDQHLGLRSENNPTEVKRCASYAMDMGLTWIESPDVPEEWDKRLIGTLETIISFRNSDDRYLMIVKNSCGNRDEEYSGCFPKCSTRPEYVTSISLDNDLKILRKWVLENIPD